MDLANPVAEWVTLENDMCTVQAVQELTQDGRLRDKVAVANMFEMLGEEV